MNECKLLKKVMLSISAIYETTNFTIICRFFTTSISHIGLSVELHLANFFFFPFYTLVSLIQANASHLVLNFNNRLCFLLRYHSNNTWIAQPTNGLSHNNFNSDTNAIPSLFCNLGNLNSLRLMRSYLSGSIPTCLGKSLFTTLDLLYNKLTIPIHPFSNPKPPTHVIFLIFYVVTYQAVILSNNHLTCPTPNNYAKLISISQLDLGGNRLSGTIPDFISQWQL